MSVPDAIRKDIKQRLWAEADRLNWSSLSPPDKARYYSIWTETKDLGGRLSSFMDPRQVRVYIKDTLLKPYTREALSSPDLAFRVLDIPADTRVLASFIKPHGRLLADGRQIAWSRATEWKSLLLALHERAFERGSPHGAVLIEAGAKFASSSDREVVDIAAQKLGIEKLIWLG